MSYPGYGYDDEDEYENEYGAYDDWGYDWHQEGEIQQPQPFDLLKLWFLGSLFFDLGEWDLFPDQD